MKGDVPLVTLDRCRDISYDEVISAKEKLIKEINNGSDHQCAGCDLLKYDYWNDIRTESVNVISIENHSLCNMKCIYCSDDYYGGVQPQYDLEYLLSGIDSVDESLHIAWGGGEPTARKDFEKIFNRVNLKFNCLTQRIFTNSLKYSTVIQEALDSRLASITTSIDAGTEEVFVQVRKSKGLNKVLKNIRDYSLNSPDLVTIKYIFTKKNSTLSQVEKFVDNVSEFNIGSCNFLISADFRDERISDEVILSMISLYIMLFRRNIHAVSFDDHVYHRVRDIGTDVFMLIDSMQHANNSNGILSQMALLKDVDSVVVWGTGEFSKYLISSSKSVLNNDIKIINVVDSDKSKWGNDFMGYTVTEPYTLTKNNAAIVIASSNFYGEILNQIKSMRISLDRVLPNFLL